MAIEAARAKATVGEISDAMEKVFGRYTGQIRTISGVYRQESGAAAIFSPGTVIPDAAYELLTALAARHGPIVTEAAST